MYKDELILLHQFLIYILKNIDENYKLREECKDYINLNISPHHIHKTKAEHKYAIFVLSKTIVDLIDNNKRKTVSDISTGLSGIVKRSEKEIMVFKNDNP